MDHGLDNPAFRFYPLGECTDHLSKIGSMGDPWICVDLSFFNQLDDVFEIGWQSISAGQDAQFATVHDRSMMEIYFGLRNSYEYQPAGETAVAQSVTHGFITSSSVDNKVGQGPAG